MSNTYKQVRDFVRDRIKTFPHMEISRFKTNNRPLEGDGAFKVPNDGKWVSWGITYGGAFASELADKPRTRRTGILVFQIFMPKGNGLDDMDDLVEKLTQHFEYYQIEFLDVLSGSRLYEGSTDTAYQVNLGFNVRVH